MDMPDGQGDAGDGGGGGESGAASAGDGGGLEGGERLGSEYEQMMLEALSNEHKNVFFFKLLRFVQKTIRVFYMSFFFYFAPFGMLLY